MLSEEELKNIEQVDLYRDNNQFFMNPPIEDPMVVHPSHYQTKSGLEVIDMIAACTEELSGIEAVCTGNAIKYLARWKKKNGVQDLKKAKWYLEKLIEEVENE